jgi:hypothetical protein
VESAAGGGGETRSINNYKYASRGQ